MLVVKLYSPRLFMVKNYLCMFFGKQCYQKPSERARARKAPQQLQAAASGMTPSGAKGDIWREVKASRKQNSNANDYYYQ
ncbi:hypothetical protein [Collimonas sp. PA-H2]|uniref:hypothetical protein n=1 Tax=Collimonas sp. PA-H2 TaxID=1881062 RepID=UPI00117CEF04|nr:hypothetical protein [Collimonas sp. PA-H2]